MESGTSPQCPHRWVLAEPNEGGPASRVRCVLCGGIRELTAEETTKLDEAAKAGVVFLHWPTKIAAGAGPRKSSSTADSSTAPRVRKPSVVQVVEGVPEGFIPVAEAAVKLGLEAKRLRKMCREGRWEATKVNGNIYVKLTKN